MRDFPLLPPAGGQGAERAGLPERERVSPAATAGRGSAARPATLGGVTAVLGHRGGKDKGAAGGPGGQTEGAAISETGGGRGSGGLGGGRGGRGERGGQGRGMGLQVV